MDSDRQERWLAPATYFPRSAHFDEGSLSENVNFIFKRIVAGRHSVSMGDRVRGTAGFDPGGQKLMTGIFVVRPAIIADLWPLDRANDLPAQGRTAGQHGGCYSHTTFCAWRERLPCSVSNTDDVVRMTSSTINDQTA